MKGITKLYYAGAPKLTEAEQDHAMWTLFFILSSISTHRCGVANFRILGRYILQQKIIAKMLNDPDIARRAECCAGVVNDLFPSRNLDRMDAPTYTQMQLLWDWLEAYAADLAFMPRVAWENADKEMRRIEATQVDKGIFPNMYTLENTDRRYGLLFEATAMLEAA